jgi:CRP/FNR family transcriptional regulator
MQTTVPAIFSNTSVAERLQEIGKVKTFAPETEIITYGETVNYIPLVIEGNISIYSVDNATGNELYLYSISGNETCTLTIGCTLAHQKSQLRAVTETEVKALLIPFFELQNLLDNYPDFRNFVYMSQSTRFFDLIHVIESVAFQHLDTRLLEFLQKKAATQGSALINMSHEQVAQALGSSRVVISRLLKQLENNKQVLLFRNQIKVMVKL